MAELRADHVGSLLRPAALLAARDDFAVGRIDRDTLTTIEDEAVLQALRMQRDAGLPVYSDGEYRRRSFLSEVAEATDGFIDGHGEMPWKGSGDQSDNRSTSKIVGGRLTKRRRLTAHEVAFLGRHAPGTFKATLPDISYFPLSSWHAEHSAQAYPRRTDLLDDLAELVRSEVTALIADGVRYIQLDSVGFTTLVDDEYRTWLAATGTDPDEYVVATAEAQRRCLDGLRSSGVTLAVHMCRGNSRGRWLSSGGYDRIAAEVFGRLPVDRWLLEYDTERAGGFEPLRHIPAGTTVVLGLVSTKEARLEDPDELIRRVEAAAKYVPVDDLALSPQCGFASVAEGNPITWDDQRRKLELVAATAQRIWG